MVGPNNAVGPKSPLKQRKSSTKTAVNGAEIQPRRKHATTTGPAVKRKLGSTLANQSFTVDIPTSPVLADFLSPLDVLGLQVWHTCLLTNSSYAHAMEVCPVQEQGATAAMRSPASTARHSVARPQAAVPASNGQQGLSTAVH